MWKGFAACTLPLHYSSHFYPEDADSLGEQSCSRAATVFESSSNLHLVGLDRGFLGKTTASRIGFPRVFDLYPPFGGCKVAPKIVFERPC